MVADPGRLGVDAATWSRLSPLLDEALELPAAERDAWLARLPAAAADLAEPLRRLLDPAAPRIERLAALPDDDATVADAPAHAAGQQIGPWRLLQPLGRGGMGEVWLAERADGLFERQVALKLPRADLLQPGLALRMARERHILAALEHPHIARLYDAGVSEQGQPFLALELVHGERIDHWCAARALGVPERLALFLQAARAVAYAHAQLVVHRDLKPSNLLVGADGRVKLLDFGIAKLLGDETGAPELTALGGVAMTPAYASPEQVAGLPAATRSDVYTLGVVLYELLTGTSPYRPERDTRGALEDAVLSQEPRRPSDAAADARSRRRLRGDLDTIVLKAQKKAPDARYATVDALIDDIERWLQQRPIRARPDSAWYTLRKLARRHRWGVAAGSAVCGALLAGAGVALWQAQTAQAERVRAEQVKDFVAGILRDASPYLGGDISQLSAVDLVRQAQQRLAGARIEQPAVRVELASLIGESLLSLGELDRAEPTLNAAADGARRELGDAHPLTLRARLLRAQVLRFRGRSAAQHEELQELLPLLRQAVDADASLLVAGLQHLAMNAIDRGAYADAEAAAAEGWQLAQRRLGESHPEATASAILLALAHRYAQHFDAARRQAELALRLARTAYPGPELHPRVVEARAVLGRALADAGELPAGVAQLQSAVHDAVQLFGPGAPLVGTLRQNLVAYQLDLGELAAADANSAAALELMARHTDVQSYAYAGTVASRAATLLALGRAGEALALLEPAARTLAQVLGPGHDGSVATEVNIAQAQARLGRADAAARTLQALQPRLAGASELTRARALRVQALVARARGDAAGAAQRLQPLLARPASDPRLQREQMRARAELGAAWLALGRHADAQAAFAEAARDAARLETGATPLQAQIRAGLAASAR